MPPVAPMLAKNAAELPEGDVAYEPKWDGFRCLVFRDGADIELGSRNDRPLTRYFPELLGPLRAVLPNRCVIDGELVIVGDDGLDFDALQARIHPADSRVQRLAGETPASFVGFDLLALGDRSMLDQPFAERRRQLDAILTGARPPVFLTPQTLDLDVARQWFSRFEGAGFDGVMAKPLTASYVPGKRTQIKVKHERTADCVMAGYRLHKDGDGVGSILLGLHDDAGGLHHVGVVSSFSAARRRELRDQLAPLVLPDGAPHPWLDGAPEGKDPLRVPGGTPSRWTGKKDFAFVPLAPVGVCEVRYDQLQGSRFRHTARLLRFRADRDATSCTYAQLDVVAPAELMDVFGKR